MMIKAISVSFGVLLATSSCFARPFDGLYTRRDDPLSETEENPVPLFRLKPPGQLDFDALVRATKPYAITSTLTSLNDSHLD